MIAIIKDGLMRDVSDLFFYNIEGSFTLKL